MDINIYIVKTTRAFFPVLFRCLVFPSITRRSVILTKIHVMLTPVIEARCNY
jgi:hypothetical protein